MADFCSAVDNVAPFELNFLRLIYPFSSDFCPQSELLQADSTIRSQKFLCSSDNRFSCQRPVSARLKKRSEEHTSELQSLLRISYAVFCLKKKNIIYKSSS